MPGPAAAAQRTRLRQLVDARFGDVRAVLGQRRAAGQVRECHGDLHCGNVVRWQGALVAFDGTGVRSGPALDRRRERPRFPDDGPRGARARRPAPGRAASLARDPGDFEAVALLPYFEAYRALVRAKVAALRARQTPAASGNALAQAAMYLDWTSGAHAARPPLVVVMSRPVRVRQDLARAAHRRRDRRARAALGHRAQTARRTAAAAVVGLDARRRYLHARVQRHAPTRACASARRIACAAAKRGGRCRQPAPARACAVHAIGTGARRAAPDRALHGADRRCCGNGSRTAPRPGPTPPKPRPHCSIGSRTTGSRSPTRNAASVIEVETATRRPWPLHAVAQRRGRAHRDSLASPRRARWRAAARRPRPS